MKAACLLTIASATHATDRLAEPSELRMHYKRKLPMLLPRAVFSDVRKMNLPEIICVVNSQSEGRCLAHDLSQARKCQRYERACASGHIDSSVMY